MIEKYQRAWDGGEWEVYALNLIRLRHGPANVQAVPAKVHGDAGIECFTTDGCIYQCYAPEEVSDVAKAASAMRAKAGRDLAKLNTNSAKIASLLGELKIRRWILLTPFLDNKEVIEYVTRMAQEQAKLGLSYIASDFIGLVHCQEDFAPEIAELRHRARGIAVRLMSPAAEDVILKTNAISGALDGKLGRAFASDANDRRVEKKRRFVTGHIRSENALEQLKRDAPNLWDIAQTTIALEEERLETIGSLSGKPAEILIAEQDRLYEALSQALPTLDPTTVRALALGQIGTWLIECPLDFEAVVGTGK
ncbi:hypothetical protein [Falsigemmobacter faecalis]|uniref:Uncharacterized protein n=1 Tax=Falsigemmobacter faecalis TaxID=2488730 RepID=A0A3P3D145_9RHOB|nr:hypothetical protein [Falsigemmobacter faecalis]RRH68139.1 hypothetical protein EG244_19815 [Falsigemmobacter faecalis]